MDGSIVRGRDLEAGESFSVLMNMDSNLIRRHRSLRNQLCLTRTAIAFLLLVCISLSAVIYIQHRAATATTSQHNLNNEGLTAKLQMDRSSNAIPDSTTNHNFTTLKMSQPLHCLSERKKEKKEWEFIKWENTHTVSSNFELSEDNESLIFHQKGWYQITLQITYQQRKSQEQQLIHYLIHNSTGYPKDIPLLSVYDVLPKCKKCIKSVHSAKMVLIEEGGDQLKVKSESMQHIFCESQHVGTANFLTAQLYPNV